MFRAMVFLCFAAALVLSAAHYGPAALERLGRGPASVAPAAGLDGPQSSLRVPPTQAAPEAEPGASEPARTPYRYVDASGSLHFVDSIDRVPDAYRATAKPMGSDVLPQLTRAETKRPRRPAGYGTSIRPRSQPPARRLAIASTTSGVVLYSTSWCGWCRKTIAWLDERGVDYENRDIEKNDAWREELVEKTGRASVPVVEIEGEIIQGFDPERMGELL